MKKLEKVKVQKEIKSLKRWICEVSIIMDDIVVHGIKSFTITTFKSPGGLEASMMIYNDVKDDLVNALKILLNSKKERLSVLKDL
jgi:hypothetical protein